MMQRRPSAHRVSPALSTKRRPALCVAIAAAFWVAAAPVVYAHARLERSTPAAYSQVQTTPQELSIIFTQNVEAAFSTITVTDAAGKRMDKGDTARIGTDRKAIRVSLTPLPPGTYKVQWRVLSVDSHKTEGEFTFSVAK